MVFTLFIKIHNYNMVKLEKIFLMKLYSDMKNEKF